MAKKAKVKAIGWQKLLRQVIPELATYGSDYLSRNYKKRLVDDLDFFPPDRVYLRTQEEVDAAKAVFQKIRLEQFPNAFTSTAATASLSKSAKIRLDTAIRAHKARLENEFNARVHEAAKQLLDSDLLPMYSKEYDRYHDFNDAYNGVMSYVEYKALRGFLHPDRHPGNEDKARKFYDLVVENEERLCGVKHLNENQRPSTLPGSVAEMLARKKA
jgi:hypothetical protein